MRTIRAALVVASLAGCGSTTHSTPNPNPDAGPTADGGAAACSGQGTAYDIMRSRFAFGSAPTMTTGDYTRWTGANGVVAIAPLGNESGELNGGASVGSLPDWSADPDALSAHVRDYFVGMGVDACQVQFTNVNARSDGQRTIALSRAIDGIAIEDSLAYARFDSDDQSTSEAFWWPTIPGDVLDQARAFRDRLADPAALAAYRALLPATARGDGQVLIRHTSSLSQGTAFRAQAIWWEEGAQRGEEGAFDESGAAVTTDW